MAPELIPFVFQHMACTFGPGIKTGTPRNNNFCCRMTRLYFVFLKNVVDLSPILRRPSRSYSH